MKNILNNILELSAIMAIGKCDLKVTQNYGKVDIRKKPIVMTHSLN
jgi:hypothetical protein